ncbi:MAG TPA: LamG domain-containing protein [Blastocatellia bacterium]|nr:LamG domain-containing protein [Blastocatellia bacterium]
MQSKENNGFTAEQVDRAISGLDGDPLYRARAILLDADLMQLYELEGLQLEGSSVAQNTDQTIRRGAVLRFDKTERDLQHAAALNTFKNHITAQNRLFHLRMNEASGSTLTDFTGNARAFTINGTVTFSLTSLGLGDVADNAIKPNGTTGYFSIAHASWMNVTALTLALAWQGTGINQTLIDRSNGTTIEFWRLEVDANGFLALSIRFTSGSPQTKTFTSTAKVNDGKPHLFHAAYDGAFVTLHMDDKRLLKVPETRTMNTTGTLGINIARNNQATNFSSGIFDEVGMIGRGLSARERRDEYQAWSNQLNELLFDKDRGDRVKILYGVQMPTPGDDGSGFAEWPQIVAVLSSPRIESEATSTGYSVTCQDQAKILANATLQERITLVAGANYITGTNGVLSIAQSCGFDTSAWAVTATSLLAPDSIDFEVGSTKLEAINYLLSLIVYKLIRFSGDGNGIIEPNKLDIDIPLSDTISSETSRQVSAENLTLEIEPRQVVNEVIVTNNNPGVIPIRGSAKNTSAKNRTSQVYMPPLLKVLVVEAPDNATADAIAQQELNNQTSRWAQRLSVNTLKRPFHDDRDKIYFTDPDLKVDGDFIEEGWVLPLNPAELMQHTLLSVVDVTS